MRRMGWDCCPRAHQRPRRRAAKPRDELAPSHRHPSDKGRTLTHRQPRIVRRITCIGTMSAVCH